MLKYIFYIFCFFIVVKQSLAQLSADAGPNKNICYNNSALLGGVPSASGGTPPYTYNWSPGTFLNSTSVSNPVASSVTGDIFYKLTVTDADGNTAISEVGVIVDKIHTFNAGKDTGYCYGQQTGVTIGAPNNNNAAHSYSWSPAADLSDPTSPNPIASPTVETIYTLLVSDGLCPDNITQVKVTPFPPPTVDAGADITINEGNTVTLHGKASAFILWIPDYNIKYTITENPDVWPTTTTVYTLTTMSNHRCVSSDTIRVTVLKSDSLYFYSAFTPNHDGDNDVFYIGNIEKYPESNLKIFNRYGKLIYSATNYLNDWNGDYLGNSVPTGTYFYQLFDGKKKTYKGTVTIIR